MREFLAAMVPVAAISVPVALYERDLREVERDRWWVAHTEQARSLAAAIGTASARPQAEALVRDFAEVTSDNPDQVAAADAMRAALDGGDLRAVADLARRAAAVESRLMVAREGSLARALDSRHELPRLAYFAAVGAVFVYHATRLVNRAARPEPPEPEAAP